MLLPTPSSASPRSPPQADQPGIDPARRPARRGDLLFDLVPERQGGPQGRPASSPPARSPSGCPRRSRAGILIGTVQRVEGEGELDRTIHVDAGRRPAQPRLRPGAHQARPPTCAPPRRRDAVTWNAGAVGRLVALGLVGGILQLTTVSQVAVFGVPADLAPLLVAAVGLLLGSVAGAVLRLRPRAASWTPLLAQTLGRHLARAARRRLRRRAAARAARPRARARARSRSAPPPPRSRRSASRVLQFLLGVDAPVSLLLVRQILLVIVLNTLLALPVYLRLPPRARARTCPTTRAAAAGARTRPAG